VPFEQDGFVAVDPFTGFPADLDGRELVERNPQLTGFPSVRDEFVLAEFEPAARGRAVAGTPDHGGVVRARASALGGQTCSSPNV
jgi:hypothetical protein